LNGIGNTNSKSALAKQFKKWVEGDATKAKTIAVKQVVENTRKPPEGSWWMKVPPL